MHYRKVFFTISDIMHESPVPVSPFMAGNVVRGNQGVIQINLKYKMYV